MSRPLKILISNWPRTRKFNRPLHAFDFSHHGQVKSNFYALIGQNLTGEFTRKIYAASGNLFTNS